MRIQEYAVGIFSGAFTKSALKKALKKNQITANGIVASTATIVNEGAKLVFTPELEISAISKLDLPLKILYEDEHLAAVHKPAGILVSGNKFKTVANALPKNLKPSGIADSCTPHPVHRLDYATTGILLIGKTKSSIRILNKMFEEKKLKKIYMAITIGEMNPYGEISSELDGKAACSEYRVKGSVFSKRFGSLNLVELSLHSGRRNQLRRHLLSIKNPILGDQTFGFENLTLKGKGLYLHAYSLEFTHPFTQENVFIVDELPAKFYKIFDKKNS